MFWSQAHIQNFRLSDISIKRPRYGKEKNISRIKIELNLNKIKIKLEYCQLSLMFYERLPGF